MPEGIFDQDRPRSLMAQQLDEAFAGCDEWTVVKAPSRRAEPDLAPWLAPAALDAADDELDDLPRAA